MDMDIPRLRYYGYRRIPLVHIRGFPIVDIWLLRPVLRSVVWCRIVCATIDVYSVDDAI